MNQLANVGGAAITYNGMGNIASDGTDSFIYTYENELAIINNAAHVVAYDASGRLAQIASTTANTNFSSLGDGMISEERDGYADNIILRRYVYGPGVDEPRSGMRAQGHRTSAICTPTSAARHRRHQRCGDGDRRQQL